MSALDGAPVQQHLGRNLWGPSAWENHTKWMCSAGVAGGRFQGSQFHCCIPMPTPSCRPPISCQGCSFWNVGASLRPSFMLRLCTAVIHSMKSQGFCMWDMAPNKLRGEMTALVSASQWAKRPPGHTANVLQWAPPFSLNPTAYF